MRTLKAKHVVADFRARLTDFELMAKYDLSLEELEKVLAQLVKAGLLRPAELYERGLFYDEPQNRVLTRSSGRVYLRVPIPICLLDDPTRAGFLTDLSYKGFRTRMLNIQEGEEATFLVRADEVTQLKAFELTAICIWVNPGERRPQDFQAGFSITRIEPEEVQKIDSLMTLLSFGDRNLMRKKTST
ncbi:PilZ domain-containing protein [Desulfomonile tiedjei]|uniref:PilZ domain-containing protein n=1 Tax=Desulfomonile tiedjei (strain ATCC 49306 / DSM 6799 / DCB-1) TaxID=706587 RepID=I4C3U3_DESTA|nr:PilZ domain-containing protein [Desulfomonile tiedjei]AFM24234.1 hypothetical protein Desti_1522 [Desulfomonile tiedjei DSM 6799]